MSLRLLSEKIYEYRRGPIAVISSRTKKMQCLQCGTVWQGIIGPGGRFFHGNVWTCGSCGATSKDTYRPFVK